MDGPNQKLERNQPIPQTFQVNLNSSRHSSASLKKAYSSYPAVFILWSSKERTKKNAPEINLSFGFPIPHI